MRIGGYVSSAAAGRKHGGHIFDILETTLEVSRKISNNYHVFSML